ncbi:odorant-binding protein-like [Phacochoerus africanus]|uniref:odorant-binding protein-like n=1 Tax=Phacochoerus africanus TaxID=41426 RepID=UPI001FD99521|nr:odorant-binding protein-like [Phacochoerus africanus]
MKVVLLSLVLGLVYSQEPQPEQYPSQISGEWRTLYGASSNQEKISEKGPFTIYFRSIYFDSKKDNIIFNFFVKSVSQSNRNPVFIQEELAFDKHI